MNKNGLFNRNYNKKPQNGKMFQKWNESRLTKNDNNVFKPITHT